jgi:hypothetical protein
MPISADQSKLLAQMHAVCHDRIANLQLFDSAALGGSVYLRNARLGTMSGIRDLQIPEDWTVKYSRDTRVICDMYEAGYQVS